MIGRSSFATPRSPDSEFLLRLAVLSLMAACGGEENSADRGSGPGAEASQPTPEVGRGENDPCALVTTAEAQQLMAAPVETGRPSEANNEYMATCRYVAPIGGGIAVLAVTVSRKNGRIGYENAKRMVEAGIAIQTVPGLGDDAFWAGYPLNTLYALQNTTYLDIGYLDVGGEGRLQQVRPLALTALRRLR